MEFLGVLFIVISCVVMWRRTAHLAREVSRLEYKIDALADDVRRPGAAPQAAGMAPPVADDTAPMATPAPLRASSVPLSARNEEIWEDEVRRLSRKEKRPPPEPSWGTEIPEAAPKPVSAEASSAGSSFEFNFGKKLPVWIGALSLSLAGFYLVKYSIEKGLLTEEVRVMLGIIFGGVLIFAARFIRVNKPDMADAMRITQALSGAGIAVLYASVFAAVTLYNLVPALTGFLGLGLTTLLACLLSLRHGMPIAVIGLIGGFVTPALIQTAHPSLPILLIYLYMLLTGIFTLIRRQNWWVLGVPALALSFAWVLAWLFWPVGHVVDVRSPEDGLFLGLFILAAAATAVAQPRRSDAKGAEAEWQQAMNYVVSVGAVLLMAIVTTECGFRTDTWALYGLLGLGTMILAWFRPGEYGRAPWVSIGTSLILLAFWGTSRHMGELPPMPAHYLAVLLSLAALYGAGSWFLLRQRLTLEAAAQLSATALGFYLVAFLRQRNEIYDLLNIERGDILHLWGFIAMILALAFAALTARLMKALPDDEERRQRLLAVAALTSTAFLSIALTIEVREKFMAVAFAAQTLAVCWVNTKVNIQALRKIAAGVFGVFMLLMFQQILMLAALVINSLFGHSLDFWSGKDYPIATDPMFQIGLPMILIGLSAWFVQRQRDGRLAETLEVATVGLGALLLYYGTRRLLHIPDDELFRKVLFMERVFITNLFFAAGLGVVWLGRQYARRAILWSGTALFLMAMFRVAWFDFLIANPLRTGDPVGGAFLVNGLALAYLMPVFWLWLEEKPQLRLVTLSETLRGTMSFVLLFTYVSLSVRQAFHGAILSAGPVTEPEVYAYSLVWLLMGAGLLFLGTLWKDKAMRTAALLLLLGTGFKVFFFDTRELGGLYRVFSLLGLGAGGLALSWFYTRFLFKEKMPGEALPPAA
jgi:hypothetical protein